MNRRNRIWLTLTAIACISSAAHAAGEVDAPRVHAEQPCATDAAAHPSALRRGAATAAILVPGVLVHGTGHWIQGHPCTARRLAVVGASGAGGILVGGSTIVFTGASRYLVFPAISLTMAGFGLFITSFAADVYGVIGAANATGEPPLRRPRWETEVGLLHAYNPHFDFEWMVSQRLAANFGMVRVTGALDTALEASHARYRLGATLRGFGPGKDQAARDGSFFDVHLGWTEQRYVLSGFISDSAELLATGRLDLVRIGPTLRGAFAELSTGVALARTRYAVDSISVPADLESLLLGRIAFGMYLGRGAHLGSEAMLYYDHRHDDYAAGLKLPGIGSGAMGHWGLAGRRFFTRHVGLGTNLEVGSALVTGLSLLFRDGGRL